MGPGTRGRPLKAGEWCSSCGDVTACLHHPDEAGVIARVWADTPQAKVATDAVKPARGET